MNNRVNILIVEDEAILAMALSDQLEDDGYCVVGVASNGRSEELLLGLWQYVVGSRIIQDQDPVVTIATVGRGK